MTSTALAILAAALLAGLPRPKDSPPPPAGPTAEASAPAAGTSVAAAEPRSPDATVGKEVRTIPLSDKQAALVHIVRTAPSYPATIEFPEAFASPPACGDCGDKALFRLDVFNEGRYLTIKPRPSLAPRTDGSTISIADFVTVLTVRLQTYTLTIQVEYTEDSSRADPRVVFTIPERPKETAYVALEMQKLRKKLEEEMNDRVERGVNAALLRALAEPHSCTNVLPASARRTSLSRPKELCVFGQRYFIRFQVENRGHAAADLGELELRQGPNRSALAEALELEQYLANDHLEFSATTVGLVAFRLDEGQPVPHMFEVIVHERGGRGRNVPLLIEP